MVEKAHIVQVEYSHVVGGAASPGQVATRVVGRALDGVRSKTVVRFYDHSGVISNQVKELESLSNQHSTMEVSFPTSAGVWKRRLYSWSCGQLLWSMRKLRRSLESRTLLDLAAQSRLGHVAIEDYPGAPFRYAQKDEMHEILEQARAGAHPWFFVFEPEELLAGKVSSYASASLLT
jgi:hypothetical protein